MKRTAPSVIKHGNRPGVGFRCVSAFGTITVRLATFLFGGRIVLMLVYNVNEHAQRWPFLHQSVLS